MYMELWEGNKLVFKSDKKEDLVENLMYYLFEYVANKSCKVKITRNYNDLQVVKFYKKYDDYERIVIFYNVPTKLFSLDVNKIFN